MSERKANSINIPNRLPHDIESSQVIWRETGGKYFFCDNHPHQGIVPFQDTFKKIMDLNLQFDNQGNQILLPPINFRGLSYLKAIAKKIKMGEKGGLVIIAIPGYGNISLSLTLPYFTGMSEVNNCELIGIEVFHDLSRVDQIKVGSSVENLQAAFSTAIRLTHEATKKAHDSGAKVMVVGASFGAKTINAFLNMSQQHGLELADRYVAIEGGRFKETFSGPYYTKKMIYPEIVGHPAFVKGYAFPIQSKKLPVHVRKLVTVFLNPTDDVALAQEQCWQGADETILIPGTHFTAPLKYFLETRKALKENIKTLKLLFNKG